MIEITMQIIYFTLIGSITGILSGLLGVGGGIISIPCIIFMFEFLGKTTPITMRIAIGSSLAAMVFTTFSSAKSHNLHKRICWPLFKKIYISFILGAITGSFFVHKIPSDTLKKIFSFFEIILGCYFFIMKSSPSSINKPLVAAPMMNGLGYLISTLSTLLGIGGSIMTVPALLYLKLSLKEAIGTSTALSFIVSIVASVSFLITDLFIREEPYTIGYIYLPAFLPISVASFFTAPIGSKLMQKVSTKILKKFFAILVTGMGVIMLIK